MKVPVRALKWNLLPDYLSSKGIETILTREPGGTQLGEAIRRTLLSNEYNSKICDDSELLLMFAARAQHIHEVIKPALDSGKTVVCDRFTDSSIAYQGGGRGIDDARITALKNWLKIDLDPDITFLFDIPVNTGLERAGKRSQADRFETETMDFFTRVRNKYLEMAKKHSRFRVIDAEQSIQEVQQSIQAHLDRSLI